MKDSLERLFIKSRPNLPKILELRAARLGQMQGAEAPGSIAGTFSISDDDTFLSLPRFDLQPRIASLAWQIRAESLLRNNALEIHLLHGSQESLSILDELADSIRR